MSIGIENLSKAYDEHVVVQRVSFEVREGECFVLLGPSGSGKSTVLRIVAGLTEPDAGRVLLRGRDVTRLAPQRRGVGLVFQQYALFGHMSVAENVEFALRVRGVPAAERRMRRDELLELVGLAGLSKRLPSQLSGGQQQRVALARALAHRPEVLLLDEPFGALDARIRLELRRTLRRIQRELGVTTVFVTHDQEEAFELADRMGVMNYGRLLEIGAPDELYLHPQTEFTATFLGKANLMVGRCGSDGVQLGELRFPLGSAAAGVPDTRRVQVLFRPEDVAVKITRDALDWPLLGKGVVEEIDFSGPAERLRLRLPRLGGVRAISPRVDFGADHMLVEASRSQHLARRYPLRPGDEAWVGVRRVHALTHPGLSFLVVDDGAEAADVALRYAGLLARSCQARVSVLALGVVDGTGGEPLRRARELLGAGFAALDVHGSPDGLGDALGREIARQSCDLVILGRPARGAVAAARDALGSGEHHLLVVPDVLPLPGRSVICAAVGEPGKQDVLFAGRLLRHLGAKARILTAIAPGGSEEADVRRFHAAALRTLARFGVDAECAVRRGTPLACIREELREGRPDLLVLGAPLGLRDGVPLLGGIVGELLQDPSAPPLLIVRATGEA